MIRLTVLGRIDLRHSDGREISSVLQQPKRLAILTYLTIESRNGLVRRDTVASVFWPDSPQEHARHSLRQAIHMLRRSMGPDILTARGAEDIGVDYGQIECDATDFAQCSEGGHLTDVLNLYHGELLPGFHLNGSVLFEDWLLSKRESFGRTAVGMAWRLAQRAEESNELARACSFGRRAAELEGWEEASVQRLIRLCRMASDRATAEEAFSALTRQLQEDGRVPARETIEALRCVETRITCTPIAAPQDRSVRGSTVRNSLPRMGFRIVKASAVFVLSLSFMALWGAQGSTHSQPPTGFDFTVIVEEFANRSLPGRYPSINRSIAAAVREELSEVGAIRVLSSVQLSAPTEGALGVEGAVTAALDTTFVRLTMLELPSRRVLASVLLRSSAHSDAGTPEVIANNTANWIREVLGKEKRRRNLQRSRSTDKARRAMSEALQFRAQADSLMAAGAISLAEAALDVADSLIVMAQKAAPKWEEPTVQRAATALATMSLHLRSGEDGVVRARSAIAAGLRNGQEANNWPIRDWRMLELHAELLYWQLLTTPQDSATSMVRLSAMVERNLMDIIDHGPESAKAWVMLSWLLESRGELDRAYLAAHRAYRADIYLENRADVLVRLFETALANDRLGEAMSWCAAIEDRYSEFRVSTYCRLTLLASSDTIGQSELQSAIAAVGGDQVMAYPKPVRTKISTLTAVICDTCSHARFGEGSL